MPHASTLDPSPLVALPAPPAGDDGRDGLLAIDREDRRTLEQLRDGGSDPALRLRAAIVLLCATGATDKQVAQQLGSSRRTVSKWRTRFAQGGPQALADRPRRGAPRSVTPATVAEILRLYYAPPPEDGPRWTTRRIAAHVGLSQSTVARITRASA